MNDYNFSPDCWCLTPISFHLGPIFYQSLKLEKSLQTTRTEMAKIHNLMSITFHSTIRYKDYNRATSRMLGQNTNGTICAKHP